MIKTMNSLKIVMKMCCGCGKYSNKRQTQLPNSVRVHRILIYSAPEFVLADGSTFFYAFDLL